jgi:geranylgeranyl pyrophosphate synthase
MKFASFTKNPAVLELHRHSHSVKDSSSNVRREMQYKFNILRDQCGSSLKSSLADAFRYHFEFPGKMLRAQLAYESARAHSASESDATRWGFAVELVHNASLIHDDICDSDCFRRGRESVMAKFGHQTALCLGDALLSHAFAILARETIPRALITKLASMIRSCSGGQAEEFSYRGYPDWPKYCEIAQGKTASLLAGAVEGGALFDPVIDNNPSLTDCCTRLALIYQILNDVNNVDSAICSNSQSTDFSNMRPNALIVLFRDTLTPKDQKVFDTSLDRVSHSQANNEIRIDNLWWERFIESDIRYTVQDKISSIMADTELEQIQLPSELQNILLPLLVHAKSSILRLSHPPSNQKVLFAKERNG